MNATTGPSTPTSLFKTSLLDWRARYQATKAASQAAPAGEQPAGAGSAPSRLSRPRRLKARR